MSDGIFIVSVLGLTTDKSEHLLRSFLSAHGLDSILDVVILPGEMDYIYEVHFLVQEDASKAAALEGPVLSHLFPDPLVLIKSISGVC